MEVGIKLRETQNYVRKDIQNKKNHFLQMSVRPDPFLKMLQFRRFMNEILKLKCFLGLFYEF